MSRSFFLLAGETSGDKLGAELMTALETRYPESGFYGMGGPHMMSQGLISHEDMSQLSIMGISEVIAAYSRLQKLADRLVKQVIANRPDAIFTIDSKAFSVRFAKKLRKEMRRVNYHAPIIHMVAPTIWAWGAWRKTAFEDSFDGLLCLFPFEPSLFDANKIQADFIGHPVAYKNQVNISQRSTNIVGLLPGSRRSEIRYILPDMLAAAQDIATSRPGTEFVLPTLPHLEDEISDRIAMSELPIKILSENDAFSTLLRQASVCMAASGTVTLELALNAMPTVTCYKVSKLNYLFMRGLFKLKDPILPHILMQEPIFPYFEQSRQTGESLAASSLNILESLPAQTNAVAKSAGKLHSLLTGGQTSFQMQLQSVLERQLHL